MSVGSWADIDAGEEVFVNRHPSKWELANDVFMGVVLVIVAAANAIYDPLSLSSISMYGIPGHYLLLLAAVVLSAGMIGISYWERLNTVYLITSKKVYRKEGIFTFDGDPIEMANVVDQQAKQNVIQKQLNIGTLKVKTAATAELDGKDGTTGYLVFENIPKPIEAKNQLLRAREVYKEQAHKEEMRAKQEYMDDQREGQKVHVSTDEPVQRDSRDGSSSEKESLW